MLTLSDNGKPPICGGAGGERWLPAVGYEGLYAVSDHGRVRSLDRVDSIGRNRRGLILSQQVIGQGRGHWSVALYQGNGQKRLSVHRQMAIAFLGAAPFDGAVVRHLDDDIDNNVLENLAWGTVSDNQVDAVRNGRNHWSSRAECNRGHDYSVSLLWKRSDGARSCAACGSATGRVNDVPKWAPMVNEVADACYRKIRAEDSSRMTTEKLMERYG